MIDNAREVALQSTEWLSALDIAERSRHRSLDSGTIFLHWTAKKQIFAIALKGEDHFPAYGLREVMQGTVRAIEPKPIMATLIEALGAECSGWRLAEWFASPNGYLHGKRPLDLLDSEPERVVKAAEFEAKGVQHG